MTGNEHLHARIAKLEKTLEALKTPPTIGASAEVIGAVMDYHELICDFIDRALKESPQ